MLKLIHQPVEQIMHEIHSNNKKIHVCGSLKDAKEMAMSLCEDTKKDYEVVHNGEIIMIIKPKINNNESRFN